MRDAIASVLLVGGGVLALLGAIGLVRFPDVFTRMHAATKAATVGVIGITAAAAVEAGTVGSALVLALVVALLFLSGPLGVSLLARAAYHDPETPMAPGTRVLPWELPSPRPSSARRVAGASPFLAVWLLFVWVAAFGTVTPGVLIGGVLVSGVVGWALRSFAPRWPEALLHPIAALRFVWHFLGQMAEATWQVAVATVRRTDTLRPAVIEVPIVARTRNEITLLTNSISFTPGTVALELEGARLFVHALHADDPDVIVGDITSLERFIIAAFGGSAAPTDATDITYRGP